MVPENEIDWRRLAEAATGLLGWTPEIFWAATPAEFWAAWDGWHQPFQPSGSAPLGRKETASLLKTFPDRSC